MTELSTPVQDLLTVESLTQRFSIRSGALGRVTGAVQAVSDVSFTIRRGETFGLVGESGCGKSTLGRCLLRLIEPTSGRVSFAGQSVTDLTPVEMRALRRKMQIIFQDPYASLNPRMTVEQILSEPLEIHRLFPDKASRRKRVQQLLDLCGLRPESIHRYPHEFSGGQRQRICIARALAVEPEFIVCDEPVSALDVSIQAQILTLMEGLQKELGLTYLFISHDLRVVQHLSHRVAVMYLGRIVEQGTVEEIFSHPRHPYTQALLSAIPSPEYGVRRERIHLHGDVPSPLNPPTGCAFHPRCPKVSEKCRQTAPSLEAMRSDSNHAAACWFAE